MTIVAELLFDKVFSLRGQPEVIISDRDPRFISKFWIELHKVMGMKLAMSTAHRAQSDGQTERTNQTIESMLRQFINYEQDNWDELLPSLEFAHNNKLNASTGFTPFYLNNGFHPRVPSSFVDKSVEMKEQTVESVSYTHLTLPTNREV